MAAPSRTAVGGDYGALTAASSDEDEGFIPSTLAAPPFPTRQAQGQMNGGTGKPSVVVVDGPVLGDMNTLDEPISATLVGLLNVIFCCYIMY
jgi:hypothetical protein